MKKALIRIKRIGICGTDLHAFKGNQPHFHGIIKDVSVLGFDEQPVWNCTGEALEISTENVQSDQPVVFKVLVN